MVETLLLTQSQTPTKATMVLYGRSHSHQTASCTPLAPRMAQSRCGRTATAFMACGVAVALSSRRRFSVSLPNPTTNHRFLVRHMRTGGNWERRWMKRCDAAIPVTTTGEPAHRATRRSRSGFELSPFHTNNATTKSGIASSILPLSGTIWASGGC